MTPDERREWPVDGNPLTQKRPPLRKEFDANGRPVFKIPWRRATAQSTQREERTEHVVDVTDLLPLASEPRRERVIDYGPDAPRRQHVRQAREAAGLSRAELAAAAYVPENALRRVEEDGWRPPESMRAAIAATLGAPETELFTNELMDALPPEPTPEPAAAKPAAISAHDRLLRLRGALRFARQSG